MSSGDSFVYQKGFFSKQFNVYTPDLTGFGNNKNMPYPYSLDDYITEVKEYIDKNHLNKPHVIAHSFGGRIVLKLAHQNPDIFDKIVLVDSAGLKPKRTLKYHVKKCAYKMAKPFLRGRKPKIFFSKDYLALSPNMRNSFVKIINEHLDYTLKDIKNKTLIVFGKTDKETPIYMAKKLHKEIKDSHLLIINNAGHFSFIDCPQKFNWGVREFLLSK